MVSNLKSQRLFPIYILGFIFALQMALPTYINSSYLGTLLPQKFLGLIYAAESILVIIGFFLLPKILRRFGNFQTAQTLLFVEMAALLGLTVYHQVAPVVIFLIISLAVLTFLSFSLDIFVEGYSRDAETGKIRGLYLTHTNAAWIFAPLLAGLIITHSGYSQVYLAALLLLILVFILLKKTLSGFKDLPYQSPAPWETIRQAWLNKNVRYIFCAVFLLQFFYAWMTIYTPIYLHTNLGLSWNLVGVIFGIMLLPFVFIQFPAGQLADKRYGEKEMLIIGFIIMALATVMMYFAGGNNIWFWALILFTTRIGAATVEVMCDTYFFKQVTDKNANLISFYRMGLPLAYIIAPVLASFILIIPGSEIKSLFLVLTVLMLLGSGLCLAIKDTK